ncbi:MAG: threonine synthase [Verrucomicrobiales bacterium]
MANLTVDRPHFVTHLECGLTGERYSAGEEHGLSRAGRPLLVRYDLPALARSLDKRALAARPPGLWRYREFLPVPAAASLVSLGEPMTPVLRLSRLEAGSGALHVKDEARLPTGSFKARGLAMAISMAHAFGRTRVALPTNGNAGAACAAYAARAGMECFVFCPDDTPEINIRETAAQGARVERVPGLITDCGKRVAEGAARHGWFDLSTLKEPYRLEGKKTMGLEIAEQFDWRLPEVILYPTGGGTGLIGMWKAFQELKAIGWLEGPLPRMVVVQASGCAPIVRAWQLGRDHADPWPDARTVASGIRVPAAVGDFLMIRAIRESGGFATTVDDDAILDARDRCATREGMLLCPESAATLAAYEQECATGRIGPHESVLLINCAAGNKYDLPPV